MVDNQSAEAVKKRVLIVDDEKEILTSLERALRIKYDVMTVQESPKVIDFLKQNRVDCILMDIRMPEITGIELLKDIKFLYPHLSILIMTGHGDEDDAITALKYGASGYIKKPINIYYLFDEISRILKEAFSVKEEKPVNILLVDDDEALLNSLAKGLACYQYKITTANNSVSAANLLKAESYDIIITDENMEKMDGIALIEEAKKIQREIIPIMITGVSTQELAIESIKAGVFDYIKKPIDLKEIKSAIDRSISRLRINREIKARNAELSSKSKMLETLNNEIFTQKEYLKNIVQSINNILIITDENGNIEQANEVAIKKIGYKKEEMFGRSLTIIYPVDNLEKFLSQVIEHNGLANLEGEYLTKSHDRIPVIIAASLIHSQDKAIEGYVFVAQDISDRKKNEEKLYQLSYYDVLTNLPNRTHFELYATQEISKASQENRRLAFFYMDLDGFKAVNDRFGHASGDLLLVQVADRLKEVFQSSGFVARLSGDEFAVCLSVRSHEELVLLANMIINMINQPIYINNSEISVGISIGVSIFPDTSIDYETLLKNADIALYRAKYNGRNQFVFYSTDIEQEYTDMLKIETALRLAVDKNEFYLEYQPIYDLEQNQIISLEVLTRWQSSELGFVSPDKFIPIAEANGLIFPISDWIIDNAFKQYAEWKKENKQHFQLAINISAKQLDQGNFLVKFLKQKCEAYHLEAKDIDVEITETAIMRNQPMAKVALTELRSAGFVITLDDFGQGYSSLSLLSKLPISVLKIDKYFVQNLNDPKNKFIVTSIISLSHTLKIKVIAEGIETSDELEYLKKLGCNYGQGYLLSEPKAPDALFKE